MRAIELIKKRFRVEETPVQELTPIDLVWIEQRVAAVLKANALESLIIGGYLQVSVIRDGNRITTGDPVSLAPLGDALLAIDRAHWASYVWEWCSNTVPGVMSQLDIDTQADLVANGDLGAHRATETRTDAETRRTGEARGANERLMAMGSEPGFTLEAARPLSAPIPSDPKTMPDATKAPTKTWTPDPRTMPHATKAQTAEMADPVSNPREMPGSSPVFAPNNVAGFGAVSAARPDASKVLISAGDFGVLATRVPEQAPDTAHGMTLAEAIPLLSMRLASDAMTVGIDDEALVPTSIPGIQAALCVGDDKWVVSRHLAAWGITAEMAVEMAEAQLRNRAAPEVSIVFLDDSTPVFVLETATPGVAALLPYLDTYVPVRDSVSSTVVAALANEHVVFVHLATESTSDSAIGTLIDNAVAEHTHRPGRINPTIFKWSPDGSLEALTPNMGSAAGRLEARQLVSSGQLTA